ncbi:DUF4338 domain-containing protein [Rhodobacterales bacterium HKCCE3408]|nr:DUF4338 domain-containing protein [Rhodobacterales bacterium HKCCE3408]
MSTATNTTSSSPKTFFPGQLSDGQRNRLRTIVEETKGLDIDTRAAKLSSMARDFASVGKADQDPDHLRFAVALSVLSDLIAQGWIVGTDAHHVTVEAASFNPVDGETVDHAKRRIRKGLQIASNRQLAEPSVREFRRLMEREREFKGRTVSIATLIDDGTDLAKALEQVVSEPQGDQAVCLDKIIRPVLEECGADDRCKETGLKLQDVWRYFRYTWSLEYNPLPGRTQRFLIRNAARKNKPVIGIAMLASPTANLGSRDEWIGWQLDSVMAGLVDGTLQPRLTAKKLVDALVTAVSEIRSDDLIRPEQLENPDLGVLMQLEQIAAQAAAQRKTDLARQDAGEVIDIRGVDKANVTDDQWRMLSETGLFRKKRAEQLIPLLRAIETLQSFGIDSQPVTALYSALVDKSGQSAIRTALNEIKKRHLATEVADLAVCGAIPPYNQLLGGKLVALAMGSREARKAYSNRYGEQVSEIASQIGGKAVIRSSDLKLITTTSLYGIGSNQYTRLSLRRVAYPELPTDVVWKKLRSGAGVSVTHISDETVGLMRDLGVAVYGRRRINSVFGEGSSPRMRQIREGLNLIGINDDSILKQSHGRKVYGCELYEGARDDLLGFGKKSKKRASAPLRSISRAWVRRWLMPRLNKADLIEGVGRAGAEEVLSELNRRAAQGSVLLGQPSTKGDEARASTASISSASGAREGASPKEQERIAINVDANA